MIFDDLDTRIVGILTADARTSNREVARITGVSEAAVRKRLRRLEGMGAARIAAVVNPAALGLTISAMVRMTTTPDATRRIAEAAAALEQVSFVGLTAGRFNVIAVVTATGRHQLADILHSQIRRWEGVVSIETVEIVSNAKHRFDLVHIKPEHIGAPHD
ncbi:MAG: Lrp/AsnC family transcriptional regulator [Reyranella sp.]|nr:Lrp/AsnC family transcriptional regulator [Reyranella sp.]